MDMVPEVEAASTAERVHNREEFRQILSDVNKLPETQRAALLLREMDALSYEEIAAAMDTTVPSVKSLLVRARISLTEASQARLLTCGEVRVELSEAAEGLRKVSAPVRRHVRECGECGDFRSQLRSNEKALAALFPVGPLFALKGFIASKLGLSTGGAGAAGAGAGTAGAGAGALGGVSAAIGGSSAASGIGAALGTKAVAGVVTAAVLTAGAVEVKLPTSGTPVSVPPPPAREASYNPPPTFSLAETAPIAAPKPKHPGEAVEVAPIPAPTEPAVTTEEETPVTTPVDHEEEAAGQSNAGEEVAIGDSDESISSATPSEETPGAPEDGGTVVVTVGGSGGSPPPPSEPAPAESPPPVAEVPPASSGGTTAPAVEHDLAAD
jgi:hypothetical protein